MKICLTARTLDMTDTEYSSKFSFFVQIACHLGCNSSRESFFITCLVELSFFNLWITVEVEVHFLWFRHAPYFNHKTGMKTWNLMKLSAHVEETDLHNLLIFQPYRNSFHWDIEKTKWKNVIPSRLDRPLPTLNFTVIAI